MQIQIPDCISIVPIFEGLPAAALQELGRAMQHRHYSRGQIIHMTGDPVSELLVVASGQLQIVHTHISGKEQVVRVVEPGELIGELGLLTPANYEGELIATVASEACILPRKAVQQLLRSHPPAALRLIDALAKRLKIAEQMISNLSLRDVEQRLAAELYRMAKEAPSRSQRIIYIDIESSWVDFANRLGTSPESISRRLRTWADSGLIERKEGSRVLRVLDLNRLKIIAGF